jgi:hypothetical protein
MLKNGKCAFTCQENGLLLLCVLPHTFLFVVCALAAAVVTA